MVRTQSCKPSKAYHDRDEAFDRCNNTTATLRDEDGKHSEIRIGAVTKKDDESAVTVKGTAPKTIKCQHSVTLYKNTLIDLSVCAHSATPTNQAELMTQRIQQKIDNL